MAPGDGGVGRKDTLRRGERPRVSDRWEMVVSGLLDASRVSFSERSRWLVVAYGARTAGSSIDPVR